MPAQRALAQTHLHPARPEPASDVSVDLGRREIRGLIDRAVPSEAPWRAAARCMPVIPANLPPTEGSVASALARETCPFVQTVGAHMAQVSAALASCSHSAAMLWAGARAGIRSMAYLRPSVSRYGLADPTHREAELAQGARQAGPETGRSAHGRRAPGPNRPLPRGPATGSLIARRGCRHRSEITRRVHSQTLVRRDLLRHDARRDIDSASQGVAQHVAVSPPRRRGRHDPRPAD